MAWVGVMPIVEKVIVQWSEALKGQVYTNISNIKISGAEANASAKYPLSLIHISVQVGEKDSPLTQALSYTQNIKLDYDQNSFIIEFSTLDYSLAIL